MTVDTGPETDSPNDTDSLVLDKEISDASCATIASSVKLLHSVLVFFEGSRNLFDAFTCDITAILDSKKDVSEDKDSDTCEEINKNFVRRLDTLKKRANMVMLELDVYGEVITQVTNKSLRLLEIEIVSEDAESELEDCTRAIVRDMCTVTHTINGFLSKFNSVVNAFVKYKKQVELFHAKK